MSSFAPRVTRGSTEADTHGGDAEVEAAETAWLLLVADACARHPAPEHACAAS
ncbi:hypothetical protein ACIQZO_36840 [Streptomyces sp. NPDC097617]|uniref:hypothetical protein n=1 Tax=Streptomyces sp. NPDC097617 TaxID=3366091 RepID=UPI003802130C